MLLLLLVFRDVDRLEARKHMNYTDRSSPIYRKFADFTGIRKDFTGIRKDFTSIRKDFTGIRKGFGKRSERVHHVLCPFVVFGEYTVRTVRSRSVRAVRKMF